MESKQDIQITKNVVNVVSDYVNTMVSPYRTFVQLMSKEHRTLQQRFTQLCVLWIEHCASDDYAYDDRNEDSHKLAKKLMKNISDEDKYLPYI